MTNPLPRLWAGLKRRLTPQKRQAWTGATISRLHDFVYGWILSAHQELRGELCTLRGRARELSRNNAYARRYLNILAENVVGPKGIRLQAQARMRDGSLDQDSNNRIEAAWKDWGKDCDVTGSLCWHEIEVLAIQTIARDGEAFIRKVPGYAANKHKYAVQFLDADQIDETYDQVPERGNNAIRMGVESNEWGRVVAFHMWTAHPQDRGMRERVRIPADQIIHLFRYRRAGQPRGETWLAPVMYGLRLLDGMTEAELVAARTSAAKMGFIVKGPDAEAPDPNLPVTPKVMEATPGLIDELGIGETFQAWDPQHPSGNFEPFTKTVLRQIASGLNVSYMALTGDLNGTSYSSGRIGSEQERDYYRMLQSWLSSHLHDVIYREWLRYAVLTSYLRLENVDFSKYENVVWRPRGFSYVDPAKDIEASRLAIASGFQSPQEIIAEGGNEIEDVYEQIAEANKLATIYGLTLDYGVPPIPEPTQQPAPQDNTEEPAKARALMLARSTYGRTA